MQNAPTAMPPSPAEEVTLSWLLENPITRHRTICSLAGIVADLKDMPPQASTDAETRDLYFLTNQIWNTLERPEVEAAFQAVRRRADIRRHRRDAKLHGETGYPRA